MKKGRTSSIKTYIVVYLDGGNTNQCYMAGQNAQQVVNAIRAWAHSADIEIQTVARVVRNWK